MAAAPITVVPENYREVRHFVLTDSTNIVMLNLLSLIPLGVAVVSMLGWWILTASWRGPEPAAPDFPWWIGLLLALVIVLPLHELIHGIAISAVGHHARYGIKLSAGVLYATADNAYFRRDEYLLVAVAPLVVITVVSMILMGFAPGWVGYYLAIGVILNAGGAVGDLWSSALLLRYPTSALIRDEQDGFRIYTPVPR
ncbi:MAG: DUF3267 domain-containing protein [Blastochloris sp.]|nr:DUF3267 domain-containing protein [Blastochloris sp.]